MRLTKWVFESVICHACAHSTTKEAQCTCTQNASAAVTAICMLPARGSTTEVGGGHKKADRRCIPCEQHGQQGVQISQMIAIS